MIPIVDLGKSSHKQKPDLEVAEALDSALKTSSCCYLKNHGVKESTLANIFDESKSLFALPSETKCRFAKVDNGNFGGFYISKRESFRERFDFMWSKESGICHDLQNFVPKLNDAVLNYGIEITQTTEYLLKLMELKFGFSDGEFVKLHEAALKSGSNIETITHMSSIFYNCAEKGLESCKNEQILMGRHTDMSTMTLLASTSPGLQVLLPDSTENEWTNAGPVEGTILVHVGDQLESLTGGRYKATVHRVLRMSDESSGRQSIPFFLHPNESAVIHPMIDAELKYAPITAKNYWEKKMQMRNENKMNTPASA